MPGELTNKKIRSLVKKINSEIEDHLEKELRLIDWEKLDKELVLKQRSDPIKLKRNKAEMKVQYALCIRRKKSKPLPVPDKYKNEEPNNNPTKKELIEKLVKHNMKMNKNEEPLNK